MDPKRLSQGELIRHWEAAAQQRDELARTVDKQAKLIHQLLEERARLTTELYR